ncbi:MAG TPA: response regulator [Bacteroidota bacterium]|nr:response regulator [Bacteroidota bacterium]
MTSGTTPQGPAQPPSKEAVAASAEREQNEKLFRQLLRQADKYIVERQFDLAKTQMAEAKKIYPNNPFIVAFEERIALFEHKKGGMPHIIPEAPRVEAPKLEHEQPPPMPVEPLPGPSQAEIEQEVRTRVEDEYKQKFTQELQKAEQLAQKILDDERAKIDSQRQMLKQQVDQQIAATREQLEADYQQQLQKEIAKSEERLEKQYKEEIAFLEQGMRKQLAEQHDQEVRQLRERIKEEENALVGRERESFQGREKELKEAYEHKLLDALRKAETVFHDQSTKQQQLEKEEIRKQVMSELREKFEKEKAQLQQQFDAAKASLQESFHTEQRRLSKESEQKIEHEVEEIRKRESEVFEKRRLVLRQELEEEYRRKYEQELDAERKKILQEAQSSFEVDLKKVEEQYQLQLKQQNEKLQTVRSEMRAQMEVAFLNRLKRVASEYDHKMELLGATVPERKEDRIDFYRKKVRSCYTNGQPTVKDARMMMELKELLELSFDEHLAVESDVRLDLYVENVERKILTGELDPRRPETLEALKQQFGVSEGEVKRLEPFIFSRFQQMTARARILVVEDDLLLLETLEKLLSDNGYAVIPAPTVDAALDKLRSNAVDFILSDIKFDNEELDGFKFFKAVQAEPQLRHVPFVFMSSLEEGVIVRSGVQLGVDDYLTKPVDPELLFAVIEGKLKRYRSIFQN